MTSDGANEDQAGGRARLLAAARGELLEHGSAGLSLRGIARRAGVSHAAPKYHFGDRAGLLTAVAAAGFGELASALRSATAAEGELSLGVLGRTYVAFGLANRALFELMFRPDQLHPDDPDLRAAQADAIGLLSTAVAAESGTGVTEEAPELALASWAFAHGLVALVRDGALQNVAGEDDPALLVERLLQVFGRVLR